MAEGELRLAGGDDPMVPPGDAIIWYCTRLAVAPLEARERLRVYQHADHPLADNPSETPLGPMRRSVVEHIARISGWDGAEPGARRGAGGRPRKMNVEVAAMLGARYYAYWLQDGELSPSEIAKWVSEAVVTIGDSTATDAAKHIIRGVQWYLYISDSQSEN